MEIKPMTIDFCKGMLKNTKRIIKGLQKELEYTTCKDSIKYLEKELKYGEYELKHWTENLEIATNFYK